MDPIEEARSRMRARAGCLLDDIQIRRNVQILSSGTLSVLEEKLAEQKDENSRRQLAGILERKRAEVELKAMMMSPPDRIPHLSGLLEQRRWDAGIVDEAFKISAIGERVFLYQVAVADSEDVQGSQIVRPDVTVSTERFTASSGILVSAGLKARDYLSANGVELGHIVRFAKLAVLRLPLGLMIDGKEEHLLSLHCSEIYGSRDLGQLLFERMAHVERSDGGKHTLVTPDGRRDGYIETMSSQEEVDG